MTITVIDEKPDVRKAEDYFKQAIETSLVNTFPKDSQAQMDFRKTGSIPQMTTISGYDAENIYKVMPDETDMPEYSLGFSAVVERAGQDLARPARLLPEGGQLTLGQIQSVIGDWTGNEEIKKSGLLNIQTANRNWQDFIQKFYTEEAVPLTQEQEESLGYKLVNAIGQSVQYVGLGSVNPLLAYLYMAMVVGEESAFNGLQAYIREHPEDTELKGFAEQSGQELLINALHIGTELYLEKAVGGFEGVIGAGTAKTATGSFLKGTAKAFGKGFLSEFPTETLQNLADVGIDWYVGRLTDKEALKGALQAPVEAVMAGIAGGATGTSLFIMNRPSGIAKIDESLTWIPDKQERQATARSIYDNMVETLNDKISVELEQSSQLRTKHGEIYESMKREVAKLVKDSGAFVDKSESEVASYIESESKRFADNVLAEANKRKLWIDDVIKASDIVEKDGRLYLQGEYFGNETGKIGQKQFQQSTDIARENERLDSIYPKYTGETLDINGVEKTVYNSSGERIAQSKEALQNFYNWFGDSKVVDEQGRPLVVYHGTEATFDVFDRTKTRSTMDIQGNFFSPWEIDARGYGQNTRAFYIRITHPADSSLGYKTLKKYQGQNDAGIKAREELQRMGYDGVNNDNEEYITFNPTQIKSIDNRGTYSPTEGNIYKQEVNWPNYEDIYNSQEYKDIKNTAQEVAKKLGYEVKDVSINREGGISAYIETPIGDIRISDHTTNYFIGSLNTLSRDVNKIVNEFKDILKNRNELEQRRKLFNNAVDKIKDSFSIQEIKDIAKSSVLSTIIIKPNSGYLSQDFKGENADIINKWKKYDLSILKPFNEIYKQTDVKNLPREKKITRGEFDALTKSIKLYEDANFSTLQHELAHYWLDNIWNYTQSGLASPEYMAQFNEVKKWLGIKDNQRFILPKQHEEFARAYEKYLVSERFPQAVEGMFNDYDNWIKSVYNTMRDVDINAGQKKYRPLSRKMFDFFDSMTTGELVAPANLEERTPEEKVKYVEKEVEKAREVIKKDQEQLEENRRSSILEPIQTNTETGYLTAYEKMTGEKVEAGSMNIKQEFNRAKDFVKNNPVKAKAIVEGKEDVPAGYVKNLIYQAYTEQQKKLGNTKERDIAMLNQALELRRMGQEIASQQNQYKNPFEKLASPLNWILDVLGNKQALLADKAKKTTEEVNKIIEKQVRDGIKENKSVKQIVNDTVEALGLPTTFKQETVEELYPANYESNITAYNEIYKAVNKALGNSLTEQEVNEITRRADEMLTNLENSMDDEGNPSIEYWEKLSDMENYANNLAPSPTYRIFTDVIGPANLMSSTKTLGFNIEANIPTGIVKAGVRRAVIGQSTSIVDKDLVRQYKTRSWEIFKRTGYNISSMDIQDASDVGRTILGEKITHAEGEGWIRSIARGYEKIIYKWGLGVGDIVFKDFAFTDHVALEASKQANGDVAKANAIFKDATRVLPETELGQEIRQRAIADALISTYQNSGKLSALSLKVRNAIDEFFPGLGKLLITFAKTPANVVGMSLETSFAPVIMAKDVLTDIVKNRGLKLNDTTKSKLVSLGSQFGITTILTMLLAYGLFDDDDYMPDYDLASQREKELARELNIPYNSVRIGDKWVSLEAFGPLAGMFSGIMAGKRAKSISDWLLRYGRSAGIQSFTIPVWGGFKEATDVGSMLIKGDVEETARKASESLANTVYSRTFPSIIADITKAFDPYERETEKSGFKKIGAKIPFVRTMLDEKVNVTTGMPEKRAQSDIQRVLMDLFAGSRLKEQVVNPIADELLRLAQKDEGVSLTGITYRGDLSKVLPEYKQKVREDFAKLYSKRVGALIKTDGYKRKTDEEKKESINAIRRAIVKELKGKYKGYIKK